MKFDNRNLHKNVVMIFKQLKTAQNVYFSYLEADDIGYLSFWISDDSKLEKWPIYLTIICGWVNFSVNYLPIAYSEKSYHNIMYIIPVSNKTTSSKIIHPV